jgi:PadR family transcriptional regulator PadR
MRAEKLKGHLDLLLLSVLSRGPGHGYEVITRLRQRSGGAFELPEGTVYPALHRLEEAGLLSSGWQMVSGRRRRIYRLTPAGETALADQAEQWREFSGSVARVIGQSMATALRAPLAGMAELVAHLRDAVAEGVAAGMTEPAAQAQAIERIGPVQAIAGRTAMLTRPSLALVRRLALTTALVGGAGLVAIGGAGVVTGVLDRVKGDEFMTAPWPAGTYTQADCARWLAGDPGAHSCVTAMLADHGGDFLLQATACGVLGLAGLAAFLVLRPRWRDRATATALPAGTAEALGALRRGGVCRAGVRY